MALADRTLSSICANVVSIQEGRFRSTGRFTNENCIILAANSAQVARGVQIWVHRKWANGIKGSKPFDGRLMLCLVTIMNHLWCIVACHAPLNTDTPENNDNVWQQLDQACKCAPADAKLVLCGDMNARLSREVSDQTGLVSSD